MAEVVIAVRGGPDAKSRCGGRLDPAQRAALTGAMLADMLEAALAAPGVGRVWVMTPTSELAAQAARAGAAIILEPRALGLSAAFEHARAAIARVRPGSVVALLPGDLPLLDPAELAALIAGHREGEVILAPAEGDGGTGAIVLTASAQFPFACGQDSLVRHAAAAAAAGFTPRVVVAPSLAFDLDRPADIETLLSRTGGARTRALLARAGTGEAAA
ncbi:MAG: 2-phospho-L-lactate guanylyltransferase [Caulobacter sp.]|nr:2-phospho-L-lactate guanylyltransferase [Caulobacter sp.]